MVVVADGTKRAASCLQRVLHNDPAMGNFQARRCSYEEALVNRKKFNL